MQDLKKTCARFEQELAAPPYSKLAHAVRSRGRTGKGLEGWGGVARN